MFWFVLLVVGGVRCLSSGKNRVVHIKAKGGSEREFGCNTAARRR